MKKYYYLYEKILLSIAPFSFFYASLEHEDVYSAHFSARARAHAYTLICYVYIIKYFHSLFLKFPN